jgi:ParB family chromosome partitioning protein
MEYRNITAIKPDLNQPRKIFDEKHIRGLARSIKQEGIINPIEIDETGMIITGECRYRSAVLLGWEKVPVNVNRGKLSEYERLRRQMAENIHQSGDRSTVMNPMDMAKGFEKLLKLQGRNKDIKELAKEIGIRRDTIGEYLEILEEPVFIQKAIYAGLPRTYIREANFAPEGLREGLKKKMAEGNIANREEVRREIQLARKIPALARINLERQEAKESMEVNKILNMVASLALALQDKPLENINMREKEIVIRQLGWIHEKIEEYLMKE